MGIFHHLLPTLKLVSLNSILKRLSSSLILKESKSQILFPPLYAIKEASFTTNSYNEPLLK